jgi:phosphomannomutase
LESFHTYRDVLLFGGILARQRHEQLVELVEAVARKDSADLGLATDGDSDRWDCTASWGNVLTQIQITGLLLARPRGENKEETLGQRSRPYKTATTHLLDNMSIRVIRRKSYKTAVGFKYIGEKCGETKPLLAQVAKDHTVVYLQVF